jgi:hypothetical protein
MSVHDLVLRLGVAISDAKQGRAWTPEERSLWEKLERASR